MKILVTGASGFVGSVLIPRLVEAHGSGNVSAFVLPDDRLPETWRHLPVRLFYGDIADADAIRAACLGHSHVIHMAGMISYWKKELPLLEKINREGTGRVVDACLQAGIERLVHISTVGAVGFHFDGRMADESTPYNWPNDFHYMRTKHAGQALVEQAIQEKGLSAVILNPASIMGPGDANLATPHNRLYASIYRRPFFGSFAGGLGIVDVRDLAAIIQKSLHSGVVGEKYLIVGANVTYRQVIAAIGHFARGRVFPVALPGFLFSIMGCMAEAWSCFSRKRPLLTSAYGRLSGWRTYYDNEKSKKTFAHEYIPFADTVRDSCIYFARTFLGYT